MLSKSGETRLFEQAPGRKLSTPMPAGGSSLRCAGLRRFATCGCAAMLLLAAATCACRLQAQAAVPAAGSEPALTLWIVRPPTGQERALRQVQAAAKAIGVYHEQTAGSFGKSASEAGQTAGSYGHAASDEGRNASTVGTNAGDYGQPASNLPGRVRSQNAGDYGQTVGSFGTAASDYTGVPKNSGEPSSTVARSTLGARWTELVSEARGVLHGGQVAVREVLLEDLHDRLAATQGTAAYPDVLLADGMPDWWREGSRGLTLTRLGHGARVAAFAEETLPRSRRDRPYVFAYGMVAAPHPLAVREFLEWWYEGRSYTAIDTERASPEPLSPEATARDAVNDVLSGAVPGPLADARMASFSGTAARAQALGVPAASVPADLRVKTAVERSRSNPRLAIVVLHSRLDSREAYGEVYTLVVLRPGAQRQWKVLQMSFDLTEADVNRLAARLDGYADPVSSQAAARTIAAEQNVASPRPAFPPDGDSRASHAGLRLWWDNEAGERLLLVEWQAGAAGEAPATSLQMVGDASGRLRTEVAAPFADDVGPVRWRVWALGVGGVIRLSDWNTVTMLP